MSKKKLSTTVESLGEKEMIQEMFLTTAITAVTGGTQRSINIPHVNIVNGCETALNHVNVFKEVSNHLLYSNNVQKNQLESICTYLCEIKVLQKLNFAHIIECLPAP